MNITEFNLGEYLGVVIPDGYVDYTISLPSKYIRGVVDDWDGSSIVCISYGGVSVYIVPFSDDEELTYVLLEAVVMVDEYSYLEMVFDFNKELLDNSKSSFLLACIRMNKIPKWVRRLFKAM